ncbi:MAG: DUF58 domain-containing protein [Sphingomonadales bacterium]
MPDRTSRTLRHEAEHLAASLPPLVIEAERIAKTVIHGVHGYRRAGPGEAFWQFRRYQCGDAASAVDWRRSAKGQHLFVREREREAAQTVWLWSDASPSMRFGTVEKAHRAALLALTLAAVLHRTGEHVAVLGGNFEPAGGRAALARIADALTHWNHDPPSGAASLPEFTRVPRYARLVLFSDFLAPIEDLSAIVDDYRARGVQGCLVQVLDPSEEDFNFSGRTRFDGLEGEGSIMIGRVESIVGDYRRQFAAWRDSLDLLSRRTAWPLIHHRTDRPPQLALLAILGALGRK